MQTMFRLVCIHRESLVLTQCFNSDHQPLHHLLRHHRPARPYLHLRRQHHPLLRRHQR
jgi:hypothetical protein